MGILAIVLAISLSAYKEVDKSNEAMTDYYWYRVDSGLGDENAFLNSELVFLSGTNPATTPPTSSGCDGGNNKCIVGYTIDQLVSGTDDVDDGPMHDSPEPPATDGHKRSQP